MYICPKKIIAMEINTNELLERFLRYVKVFTTSNSQVADSGICPSTNGQFDLAKMLEEEMKNLGFEDVSINQNCFVYGVIPKSKDFSSNESVLLMAHLDTAEDVTGKDVNPIIWKDFSDKNQITLPNGIIIDDEDLKSSIKNNETIITSDGNTLLGADDKAGIASILQAIKFLKDNPKISHRKIEVIFSPDEETGHSMDYVPLENIQSKFAYTVDGGHIGELEIECFNAYKSEVTFFGNAIHTGSARPNLVNAVAMASNFVNNLPRHQAPETTDGYQGFFAPISIEGSMEKAKVSLLLRDFDKDNMQKRMELVELLANATKESFGGRVEVKHSFQYANMKEKMDNHPKVVSNLIEAYKESGIVPKIVPIRGGTDGSRLTEMGIPTPNIFTGGHNYHSRKEWCSVNQMAKCVEVLVNLLKK